MALPDLPYPTPEPTDVQRQVAASLRRRGRTLGDQLVATGLIARPASPDRRPEAPAVAPIPPRPTLNR